MKVVALLSGGIDSPVAIHKVKGKAEVIAVHFHQMPLTGDQEIRKVEKLADKLGIKKLFIIPFTDVFKALVDKCDHRDYYVLSKIAMFRAAEIIAKQEGAEVLVTGENLGQVSSQTLSNMKAITINVKMPIVRPLLTNDKQETIDIAKDIDTYEISKGPEVCSLLGPTNPRTQSKLQKIEKELSLLDLMGLIKYSISKAEVLNL